MGVRSPVTVAGPCRTHTGFPCTADQRTLVDLADGYRAGMADLLHLAFVEADGLGHRWVGTEHLVLALLRPSAEPSAARDVLEACGVSHGRYEELLRAAVAEARPAPAAGGGGGGDRGATPNPALYGAVGRAEGLALAFGDTPVSPEHALVAVLWGRGRGLDLLDEAGVDPAEVLTRLAAAGIAVPTAALPPKERPPWGPPVEVPVSDLPRVRDALLERLEPGTWGWNVEGDDRAWVAALGADEGGPDLPRLVREILAD